MKQQLTTLGKVFDRVDAMSAACYDMNIDVPDISFDNLDVLRIAGEPHPVRPIAQRSVSNRLGIPYPYLRRCPEDIQALNLNHWIKKEKNEKLQFRFDGDDVRAVFTTKYIPVDNFEVCERLDSLGYGPETEVQCRLDPEFISLSIPDGKSAFDIDGDKFKPGISISSGIFAASKTSRRRKQRICNCLLIFLLCPFSNNSFSPLLLNVLSIRGKCKHIDYTCKAIVYIYDSF